MRFNICDYQDGNYVMRCSTREESDSFREYLCKAGKHWSNGRSYNDVDHWGEYRDQFCYNFNHGRYGPLTYYKSEGYTILESVCFEFGDETEPEIQVDQLLLKYDDIFSCGAIKG